VWKLLESGLHDAVRAIVDAGRGYEALLAASPVPETSS